MASEYLTYQGPKVAKYLQEGIKLRGGLNQFGKPKYRLVWAPLRFEYTFGLWHDWDESLSANERNYIDRKGNELNKPLRVVEEFRWTPKYPGVVGWLLEKWCPPEKYGSPKSWFSLQGEGGTCKWSESLNQMVPELGDYPWYGDYEDTGYIFPNEAVTEAIVLNAIGRIEHYVDTLPSTLAGRMKRNEYLAKLKDEKKEAALEKKHSDIVGDSGWAFNGKPFSSGAGEKRQSDREATAEKIGLTPARIA